MLRNENWREVWAVILGMQLHRVSHVKLLLLHEVDDQGLLILNDLPLRVRQLLLLQQQCRLLCAQVPEPRDVTLELPFVLLGWP